MAMSIGKKIGLVSAGLVGIAGILGVLGLVSATRMKANIDTLTGDAIPGLTKIGSISGALYRFRGDAWKHIASPDKNTMSAVEKDMEELKRASARELDAYARTIFVAEDRANFDALKQAIDRYYSAWDTEVCPISRLGTENEKAYARYMAVADPRFRELNDVLERMLKWNGDYGMKVSTEADSVALRSRASAWVVLLIGVAFGCLATVWLVRGLNVSLSRVVRDLSDTASQVASAAGQVSSTSQSLAQGASRQAASLEETSASSAEISAVARQNTENSRAAAELVAQSQQKFMEANESLSLMVGAINQIDESSGKISRIIKVIDEIAFQTNILALNAAVEAARAGEAGMGFAVVADEVRNLAHRCAQAAQETAGLIEDSIAKSSDGKGKVDHVSEAIRLITGDVSRVKHLVDEVKQSSVEQSRGIDQIGSAITQMEQVTQTAAASAEEGASAAEQLTAQSESLRDIVRGLEELVHG